MKSHVLSCRPRRARRFQHRERPDEIGLDERRRPGDGTVDVRLRSEMHYSVDLIFREHLVHQGGVGDVALREAMPKLGHHVPEIIERACVCKRVERRHSYALIGLEQMLDKVRADETRSTGDENGTRLVWCERHPSLRIVSVSASRHERGVMPNARSNEVVSSTDQAGRRAAVGYSAVVIDLMRGGSPPRISKIAFANSYQLVIPELEK